MPLFEYRCSACQHLEEVLQKHSDPAPDTCPRCNAKETLKKELSLTSFQLKGGGWYKDLYSSTSSSSTSSSSDSSSSSSSSSTGSSSSASSSSSGSSSSTSSSTSSTSSASSTKAA